MITQMNKVADTELYEVEFNLGHFSQQGRQMIVTGDFINWTLQPAPRASGFVATQGTSNTFSHKLPVGSYEYKYYDLLHAEWMEIDRYPDIYRGFYWDYVINPYGTMNCIVHVRG